MPIDPICGRTVDESVSVPPEGEEAAFCFCGERCRRLFLSTLGSPRRGPAPCPTLHHKTATHLAPPDVRMRSPT
ncbi:MAG TPA: hypothetical protein VF139_05445 [Candidatus Polarisedimenticolaceae bacterium]